MPVGDAVHLRTLASRTTSLIWIYSLFQLTAISATGGFVSMPGTEFCLAKGAAVIEKRVLVGTIAE